MSVRKGMTLVEVVVAILVFSVGGLGLAASSAAITRQMTSSLQRSRAAAIARSRDETLRSLSCGSAASGDESRNGIRAAWEATSTGEVATLDQRLQRPSLNGIRTDQFLSAMPCS